MNLVSLIRSRWDRRLFLVAAQHVKSSQFKLYSTKSQLFGNNGEEKLPFNKQKPQNRSDSRWAVIWQHPLGYMDILLILILLIIMILILKVLLLLLQLILLLLIIIIIKLALLLLIKLIMTQTFCKSNPRASHGKDIKYSSSQSPDLIPAASHFRQNLR